mgnify:CR=1 FL=1
MQELETQLRKDLSKIGLNVDFTLSLRPYSKSYFGRYDINTSTIIVYVNKTPNGDRYSYEDILLTTIHEAIHCKQWHDPKYKRVRGVMHDLEFKRLYSIYSNRAKAIILFREVVKYDCFCEASGRQSYDHCGFHC